MKPRLYTKDMTLIRVLQNASNVGYDRKFNDLHTASFKLPLDDPKNDLCQPMCIVEIYDGEESKGLYRILDNPECEITKEGEFLEYSCEHVIAFLMHEIIDGYLEDGGYNRRTRAVIETVLNKQLTRRWQLGRCDFDRQFEYSWENTNVLDALFSIPKCFDEDYHWTYDLSTYPWTINLERLDTERACEIRRKRNMVSIKRTIDSTQLTTRLYCKGYGEGVNQMTIAEVNNGKPYLDAEPAIIAKYGILSNHLIDRRFTNMENLKAYGQQVLDRLKNPIVSYSASAIDLSRITGYSWDKSDEGKTVHIIDEEKNIDIDAVIVEVRKDDVDGDPLEMEITISNQSSDITSDIESIAQRAAINSQYAQGATNLYCQQFADNADPTHPAKMKFYIPDECSRINEVLLCWECAAFRAYSKGAASGGGTSVTSQSGGQSTVTSADGGQSTVTSAGGGGSTATSAEGGGGERTSRAGGSATVDTPAMSWDSGLSGSTSYPKTGSGYMNDTGASAPDTKSAGSHQHNVKWGHQHTTSSNFKAGDNTSGVYNYSSMEPKSSSDGSHAHETYSHSHDMKHFHTLVSLDLPSFKISIPSHSHTIDIPAHTHTVSIPSHTHDVTIPAHTHNVSIPNHTHDVTIPNHTHDIVYGIYEGTTANTCTLKVDGTTAQTGVRSGSEIDIIRYLSKNDEGKINRSTWHTIVIVPDKMSRIEMNLFVKTFVTSHTGGNY